MSYPGACWYGRMLLLKKGPCSVQETLTRPHCLKHLITFLLCGGTRQHLHCRPMSITHLGMLAVAGPVTRKGKASSPSQKGTGGVLNPIPATPVNRALMRGHTLSGPWAVRPGQSPVTILCGGCCRAAAIPRPEGSPM